MTIADFCKPAACKLPVLHIQQERGMLAAAGKGGGHGPFTHLSRRSDPLRRVDYRVGTVARIIVFASGICNLHCASCLSWVLIFSGVRIHRKKVGR